MSATASTVRVLVVDDEPSLLDDYRIILGNAQSGGTNAKLAELESDLFRSDHAQAKLGDVALTACQQGADAIAAVSRAVAEHRPFAVAFLDLRMPPGLHGLETAAKIRSIDPYVYLVFVTAYSDVHPLSIVELIPPADRVFFIHKPFHASEIQQLVNGLSVRWRDERVSLRTRGTDTAGLPLQQPEALLELCQGLGDCAARLDADLTTVSTALNRLVRQLEADVKRSPETEAGLSALSRSQSLLNRLLAVARYRFHEPTVVDIGEILRNMLQDLESHLEQTVKLEIVISSDLWPVSLDAGLLRCALSELAANAKESERAGGLLRISVENAHGMQTEREEEGVLILVSDNGTGMRSDIRTRALRPFFTTRRAEGHLGLGLAAVHSFVLQSSGDLKIESHEGRGTTVKLFFPKHGGGGFAPDPGNNVRSA